jgi:hypothetical protein
VRARRPGRPRGGLPAGELSQPGQLGLQLTGLLRRLAQTVTLATVRSLDAIHLGTALRSRSSLTSFVTYDKRLLDAAQAAGLPINAPA